MKEKIVVKKSEYIGVHWNPWCRKWHVQIRDGKSMRYIGLFTDIIKAAKAYDKEARKLNKVRFNFMRTGK